MAGDFQYFLGADTTRLHGFVMPELPVTSDKVCGKCGCGAGENCGLYECETCEKVVCEVCSFEGNCERYDDRCPECEEPIEA